MGVKQDSYFVHIALWICFSSMYSHTLSVTKIEEDNWLFNMGYLYCRRSQSCIPWLLIPNQVNWDHFHAYYKCFMCVYLKQHTMLLWMWQCLYSKTPSIRSELLQMNFGPPPPTSSPWSHYEWWDLHFWSEVSKAYKFWLQFFSFAIMSLPNARGLSFSCHWSDAHKYLDSRGWKWPTRPTLSRNKCGLTTTLESCACNYSYWSWRWLHCLRVHVRRFFLSRGTTHGPHHFLCIFKNVIHVTWGYDKREWKYSVSPITTLW